MKIRKQCPHCPLNFQRTEHLNRHLNVHSGLKSFSCSTCQRPFSRLDALQRHSKIHKKIPTAPLSPPTSPSPLVASLPTQLNPIDLLCAASLVTLAKPSKSLLSIQNLIN